MSASAPRLLMAFYFYPRGGSAHAARALSIELGRGGFEVTLLSGSRADAGADADAAHFFAGPEVDLRTVDFTPALAAPDPQGFDGPPGTAPMHGSFEDREGAADRVLARLDEDAFELQVAAWERELVRAGGEEADLLYLHHLTPINEAAERILPGLPVVGHVHGSELLMLERIARGGLPAGWEHADDWRRRICRWAARCDLLVVNAPHGRDRAAALLGLEPDRFLVVANGFDPEVFRPREVDRAAFWRRRLVEDPKGWRPGEPAGSVGYREAGLGPLIEGTTLLYSGRFTEVKRLPMLIEAYAEARPRFRGPAALVLLGGYPDEWEGEHPIETIERLGLDDVYLAGWHGQEELPEFLAAADAVVHAAADEQFGQVLVEAMACARPVVAVNRGGPAAIVEDGVSGWLVDPGGGAEALSAAMVDAVNDPGERRRRGERARASVLERYSWSRLRERLVGELMALVPARRAVRPAPSRRCRAESG